MDTTTCAALRERLESLAGGDAPGAPISIAELADRFNAHASAYYLTARKGCNEAKNFAHALEPVLALYSDTLAGDFGPVQLRACRQLMVESDLARSVINDRVRRIRRVFRWAVSQCLLEEPVLRRLETVDPLKRGRSGARETEPVRPVEWERVEAVLFHLTEKVRDAILVQWWTGARPGEVVMMRGDEIREHAVRIDGCDQTVLVFSPSAHKTAWRERSREIVIGPRAREIVERRWTAGYLFPSRHDPDVPMRESSVYNAVRRACERVGVAHWHPSQIRHSRTTATADEFGVEVARAQASHADARMTLHYARQADRSIAARAATQTG